MIALLSYFCEVVFKAFTFDLVICSTVLIFLVSAVVMIKSLVKGR